MRDVARFLTLALTEDHRRQHEHDLLAAYLEELASHGATYSWRAATEAYRTALALQWGWAVIFFRMESLWDAATRAAMPLLVRRAAAAFDDVSGGF